MMVTGDNAQCGHFIAKECGMVAAHAQVLLGDCDDQNRFIFFKPCCRYTRMFMLIKFYFLKHACIGEQCALGANEWGSNRPFQVYDY